MSEDITIFINRGIVIIAGGHTFYSSTLKVGASMILPVTPTQSPFLSLMMCSDVLKNVTRGLQKHTAVTVVLSYHIVILETAPSFEEPCHRKS